MRKDLDITKPPSPESKTPIFINEEYLEKMVGVVGLEPTTSTMST